MHKKKARCFQNAPALTHQGPVSESTCADVLRQSRKTPLFSLRLHLQVLLDPDPQECPKEMPMIGVARFVFGVSRMIVTP